MKWLTAIYRNIFMLIITIILLSVITHQCLISDMFDMLTVILLVMIFLVYLMYLYIWKMGKELIEG